MRGLSQPGTATFSQQSAQRTSSANGTFDTAFNRPAAGIISADSSTANNGLAIIRSGHGRVTSDFTTAANTSLQTITGLSWTLPATAINYSFSCKLMYSQGTANAAVAFGVQAATNSPTNIMGMGKIYTSTTALTAGTLATLIYRKIKKQFKKEGEANRTHHVGLVWILAAGIEHRH